MDVCNNQVVVVQSAQGSGGITHLGGFQEKGRCNTKECGLLGIVGMGWQLDLLILVASPNFIILWLYYSGGGGEMGTLNPDFKSILWKNY